jgi:hypothetical protein
MRCYVCGRETPPRQRYCDKCRRFIVDEHEQLKRREALRAAYDADIDGFRCHWCGAILEERDRWNPFHLCFDHVIPQRSSGLVASSMLFNSMKAEFTPDEFLLAVRELAAHRAGRPFDRDLIEFKYWRKRAPSPPEPGPRLRREELTRAPKTDCAICGGPSFASSIYCKRCRRYTLWAGRDRRMHAIAMKRAWSPKENGFLCSYTGVRLDDDDPRSPWYLTFDHRIPGDKGTLVVAAWWVNAMKTALSDSEFWAVVMEYDRYMREGGEFDRHVVDFEYWKGVHTSRRRRSR